MSTVGQIVCVSDCVRVKEQGVREDLESVSPSRDAGADAKVAPLPRLLVNHQRYHFPLKGLPIIKMLQCKLWRLNMVKYSFPFS